MSRTISAAVYETHGIPADVLRVEPRPWPTPAADEAVVKMSAAPINPADLNQIEGKYPVRPELPATPGFEGAGVVVELGAGVKGLTSGALVILPHNVGTWRDAVAVKAEELVVVPDGIEPVQAAMLKINPLTAWRLLHDYVDLQKGDWLIQNAANSATGRDVIQIAHELGYKTVNVVRRAELVDELRAEGGDVVLVDGDNLREEVKSATGGASIRLGLNSVGGDSALRLANCLAPGGTLVSFGAMSLQPLKFRLAFSFSKICDFAASGSTNGTTTPLRLSAWRRFDRFSIWPGAVAQNKSRKNLSAKRSQSRSRTCRARQTQR